MLGRPDTFPGKVVSILLFCMDIPSIPQTLHPIQSREGFLPSPTFLLPPPSHCLSPNHPSSDQFASFPPPWRVGFCRKDMFIALRSIFSFSGVISVDHCFFHNRSFRVRAPFLSSLGKGSSCLDRVGSEQNGVRLSLSPSTRPGQQVLRRALLPYGKPNSPTS